MLAASKGEESKEQLEAVEKKFVPPPRPSGLRSNLLIMYTFLAAVILASFASSLIWEYMDVPVPEGKFRDKYGSLIDIDDFDAAELGPYPKCHPHFEEHQVEGADAKLDWVKNFAAPKDGPFPVGHPKNPEWVAQSAAELKKEYEENRLTWAGLKVNLNLLLLATPSVLIGCKQAVWFFTEPTEDRQPDAQYVPQSKDAALFLGSVGVIFGLLAVLKHLGFDCSDQDWVTFGTTCAYPVICIFGVGANFDFIFAVVRNKASKPFPGFPHLEAKLMLMELFGGLVGAAMFAYYLFSKNWIINNVFGVMFCIVGIKTIAVPNYLTGVILLIGVFFFDIFWFSDPDSISTVSLAMGVEAPIQLMFPRSVDGCGIWRHGMLGLGNTVVPGIFLSFLAKWDAMRMGECKSASFVYLSTTMIAYVLSLVTYVSIMHFFGFAQPAMVYIVPYVLITSLAVAVIRGDFFELLSFTIPDEAGEEEAKKGFGEGCSGTLIEI